MLLKEEINKYLHYCKFQKELDSKTIKAYRADLDQFITLIEDNDLDKEKLNSYLQFLHRSYKQKTVKRKIASVKALFNYLEEEEIIEINPFHKVKTKFKEEVVLPKVIPRDIIEQLLEHLYRERGIEKYSEWHKKISYGLDECKQWTVKFLNMSLSFMKRGRQAVPTWFSPMISGRNLAGAG